MRRRDFITVLGGAAVTWPLAARAQQAGKVPRIGALQVGPSELSARLDPLLKGLHELGYTQGQNTAIERRYGEWKLDRLPELAAELVRLKVDVIVAFSTPAARAAKQATSTTHIVALATAVHCIRAVPGNSGHCRPSVSAPAQGPGQGAPATRLGFFTMLKRLLRGDIAPFVRAIQGSIRVAGEHTDRESDRHLNAQVARERIRSYAGCRVGRSGTACWV